MEADKSSHVETVPIVQHNYLPCRQFVLATWPNCMILVLGLSIKLVSLCLWLFSLWITTCKRRHVHRRFAILHVVSSSLSYPSYDSLFGVASPVAAFSKTHLALKCIEHLRWRIVGLPMGLSYCTRWWPRTFYGLFSSFWSTGPLFSYLSSSCRTWLYIIPPANMALFNFHSTVESIQIINFENYYPTSKLTLTCWLREHDLNHRYPCNPAVGLTEVQREWRISTSTEYLRQSALKFDEIRTLQMPLISSQIPPSTTHEFIHALRSVMWSTYGLLWSW